MCSALRAFFILCDTHFSQITDGPLSFFEPLGFLDKPVVVVSACCHFHTGVKSPLHWTQTKGAGGGPWNRQEKYSENKK